MANSLDIVVDGISYHVGVTFPNMKRSFTLKEGGLRGEAISGLTIRDILGTVYEYEMTFTALPGYQADYDNLYYVLSEPVDSHRIILPFNQTTIEFDAAIESGEDYNNGNVGYKWNWDGLTVRFIPMEPQR